MFGMHGISRCPYCGKAYIADCGVTDYYEYKGETMIKLHHCGKTYLGNVYELPSLNSLASFRFGNKFEQKLIKYWQDPISQFILEQDLSNLDEDTIINNVIKKLYLIAEKEDVEADLLNIKTLCQLFLGNIRIPKIPEINIDQKQIKYVQTICW